MKKTLLIIAASLFIGTMTQAQIKNDRGTFNKPASGEWSFETQMSPNLIGGGFLSLNDGFLQGLVGGLDNFGVFTGSDSTSGGFQGKSPTLPLIRARKYSENGATRFLFNLSYSTHKSKFSPQTGNDVKSSQSQFGLTLGYGKECHKTGAERLVTYVGWDAMIGIAHLGAHDDNGTNDVKRNQMAIGLGARVFTGFDYYFIPKVYIGLELGLGLGVDLYGKVKNDDGDSTTPDDNGTSSADILLSPYVLPSFRLGYRL